MFSRESLKLQTTKVLTSQRCPWYTECFVFINDRSVNVLHTVGDEILCFKLLIDLSSVFHGCDSYVYFRGAQTTTSLSYYGPRSPLFFLTKQNKVLLCTISDNSFHCYSPELRDLDCEKRFSGTREVKKGEEGLRNQFRKGFKVTKVTEKKLLSFHDLSVFCH